MSSYIVDNSVWWKAARCPAIADRLRRVSTEHVVLTCPPQVLEYCFSAPTAAAHDAYRLDMEAFLPASEHPHEDDVLEIQGAVWHAGHVRGAGPVDVLIAAYALANDATVLTADRDFDRIAAAVPALRHEYLAES